MADPFAVISPGCYRQSASDIRAGKIEVEEFLKLCLDHLGPPQQRARHHEDDNIDAFKLCRRLVYNGVFGPAAGALKLCESDPLASTFSGHTLLPYFLACASKTNRIDAVQSANPSVSTADVHSILESALFRQAMFFIANASGNLALTKEIINYSPIYPQQLERSWILRDENPSFETASADSALSIPESVWTELLKAGWVMPSTTLIFRAPLHGNVEEGIALLDAAYKADSAVFYSGPVPRIALQEMSLTVSTPQMLQYVWSLLSVENVPTKDMLLRAIDGRKSGGVEMFQWLLDQGLDVNYERGPDTNDVKEYVPDPRIDLNNPFSYIPSIPPQRTPLHGAALTGNVEAVEFLLSHGARIDVKDGLGKTPREVAEKAGNEAAVRALDAHARKQGTS